VNLWKSLYQTHGLQPPRLNGLNEHVFETFEHLYEKLEDGKSQIPLGRFHELRYEELVKDPIGEMRKLYDRLNLGSFSTVLPRLQEYVAKTKDYQTNKYERSPEVRAEIGRRWGRVIERYGYSFSRDAESAERSALRVAAKQS
jgi:hypothetical protein